MVTLGKDEILKLEVDGDLGVKPIKDYLQELLEAVWREGESFSGKRPFGNSGWQIAFAETLGKAGVISAEFCDEYLEDYDKPAFNLVMSDLIRYCFER